MVQKQLKYLLTIWRKFTTCHVENHHARGPVKSISVFLASRWQNGHPATNKQVKVHVGRTCGEELAPLQKRLHLSYVTDTNKVPDHRDGNHFVGKD